MSKPIEFIVGEEERALIHVCSDNYVKLVFKNHIFAVRELDGIMYSYTETRSNGDEVVEEHPDPIVEACWGWPSVMFSPSKSDMIKETFNSVNEGYADLLEIEVNLRETARRSLETVFENEYDTQTTFDSDLNYETDTEPALDYHFGDTPGDTQLVTDDEEETQRFD
jgi:hypothetical protein